MNDIVHTHLLLLQSLLACLSLYLGLYTLRERGSWTSVAGVGPSRQQRGAEETRWASSSSQRQTYPSSCSAASTTSHSVVRDIQRWRHLCYWSASCKFFHSSAALYVLAAMSVPLLLSQNKWAFHSAVMINSENTLDSVCVVMWLQRQDIWLWERPTDHKKTKKLCSTSVSVLAPSVIFFPSVLCSLLYLSFIISLPLCKREKCLLLLHSCNDNG